MNAALAAGVVMQCFMNPSTDGSTPAGYIPAIRVAVPAELAESVKAGQPLTAAPAFVGEEEGLREWRFASRPAEGQPQHVLRVSVNSLPLMDPYAARYGTVTPTADGRFEWTTLMTGGCKLAPVAEAGEAR